MVLKLNYQNNMNERITIFKPDGSNVSYEKSFDRGSKPSYNYGKNHVIVYVDERSGLENSWSYEHEIEYFDMPFIVEKI